MLVSIQRGQASIDGQECALSVGTLPVLVVERKVHREYLPGEVVVSALREDPNAFVLELLDVVVLAAVLEVVQPCPAITSRSS